MNDQVRSGALALTAAAVLLAAASACAVGPAYVRPEAPHSPVFKEAPPAGWKAAQPRDDAPRGPWWNAFSDPALDALEARIDISNQNVLAAEAQYRAARAVVRIGRATLFPSVSATPSVSRSGSAGLSGAERRYALPVDLAYQADVWGAIRRSVSADAAVAQATAAQLENARLSFQAELAADYFQLEGIDAERRLLAATVASYERSVELARNRFEGGVATLADVALATTQLETARAQAADLGIARAQFEHAIAVLTGASPATVSLPDSPVQTPPPLVAVTLPAELLERRPDIAAAERQVAAANAQIGVARAAFYPTLTLGVSASSAAAAVGDLFTAPTRMWSLGAQLAATLFDGGKRRAQVQLSEAAYDATAAAYRQAVLTAFQQVEDRLAELRILSEEETIVGRSVAAAQQSLDISTIQYRGGLTSYLQVITAQTSLLQNQREAVDVATRRLLASVALIQGLGGGWDASQLPSARDVRAPPERELIAVSSPDHDRDVRSR
jgi:NodT family efflux transporter outer membrane factor (OMF) lipoprotein